MKSIVLIGYMGAGKTTIGHAMAKEMGLQFYDLDWYIEMRFHRTVAQIFEERGEEGFREIERNMLHEVAEFENVIISCGGGPLIVGKTEEELTAYIRDMLEKREPFYMKAKHIFNVDLLNSREKVAESVRLLREATGI